MQRNCCRLPVGPRVRGRCGCFCSVSLLAQEVVNAQRRFGETAYHAAEEISDLSANSPELCNLPLCLFWISPGTGHLVHVTPFSVAFQLMAHMLHILKAIKNLSCLGFGILLRGFGGGVLAFRQAHLGGRSSFNIGSSCLFGAFCRGLCNAARQRPCNQICVVDRRTRWLHDMLQLFHVLLQACLPICKSETDLLLSGCVSEATIELGNGIIHSNSQSLSSHLNCNTLCFRMAVTSCIHINSPLWHLNF
mmetsp:Transcript_31922/g.59636  ORF Transcript_31922/g.59636 Transcript_31922/m.59636 type:complete len:249 (+) Transcript_31922:676-1422(+)